MKNKKCLYPKFLICENCIHYDKCRATIKIKKDVDKKTIK